MPMVKCMKCEEYHNNAESETCPNCGATLPTSEYSSEDADNGG